MDDFKLLTGRENPFLQNQDHTLIHQDIISSFIQLQKAAKSDINADLQIISGYRDFDRQLAIFNAKALGERKILNDQEELLEPKSLTPLELLEAILRFSALPGVSRHHWGTDIDIYDASQIKKEDVQLKASECENNGACAELHLWLDEQITQKNAFGFYRPYQEDLGGVSPEKWHISYKPLSDQFFESYTLDIFLKNLNMANLELKTELLKNPEYFFERYFQRINRE
tara:strand:- start:2037 stop:2717 length:681 start_codon:yes stop_codon:yes gene_type:complete